MKKTLVIFGLVLAFSIPAFADIDCATVQVCTLDRPDGLCHPAVLFNVITAQSSSGTFSICDGTACSGKCSDPSPWGPFDFAKGLSGVLLTFADEPAACTTLASQWVADACPATCGDHHCVTPTCPIGAEAFLKEVVIK